MSDWAKSSYCASGNCVEVKFVRSSLCSGGSCVEVGVSDGSILVRDSKNPDSVLSFTRDEWIAFVKGVENGEFRYDV